MIIIFFGRRAADVAELSAARAAHVIATIFELVLGWALRALLVVDPHLKPLERIVIFLILCLTDVFAQRLFDHPRAELTRSCAAFAA